MNRKPPTVADGNSGKGSQLRQQPTVSHASFIDLAARSMAQQALASPSILSDGDYGDVTVSGTGTVFNLNADVVGPTELAATAVTPGSYANANITVDQEGRVTAAASGGGSAGFTALTFNSSTTTFGGRTFYAATSALPAWSSLGKLWLQGLIYSASGANAGVFISPDATTSIGHVLQGSDGDIVHYRNTTAINALGASSPRKYTGQKRFVMTHHYDGGNWFCSAEIDFERHLNSGDASPGSAFTTGSPTFTVYIETDDISKCSLSYRIAS